jgi:hypothetical protein
MRMIILPAILRGSRDSIEVGLTVCAIWTVTLLGVIFPSRSQQARTAARQLNSTLKLLLDRHQQRQLPARK